MSDTKTTHRPSFPAAKNSFYSVTPDGEYTLDGETIPAEHLPQWSRDALAAHEATGFSMFCVICAEKRTAQLDAESAEADRDRRDLLAGLHW